MKASIIGMGSIGKRHHMNLKAMDIDVKGYDLGDDPDYDVDFCVICTVTDYHCVYIKECCARNVPFFVEKPLFSTLGDAEIIDTLDITTVNMVACNLRFNPSIKWLKDFVDRSKSNFHTFHCSIADSNPRRELYLEHIALQDIHEFDYLAWIFGSPIEIYIQPSNDYYDSIVRFKDAQGTVHGDKISEIYTRNASIASQDSSISLNISPTNADYYDQMKYFVECLKSNTMPMNTVKEAYDVTTKVVCGLYNPS